MEASSNVANIMFNLKMIDNKPTIDSVTIAKAFGRRHDNVMVSIKNKLDKGVISLLSIKETSYTDKSNRQSKMYVLDEQAALIVMPFIGGRKSEEGQVALVQSFLKMREYIQTRQDEKIAKLKWHVARERTKVGSFELREASRAYHERDHGDASYMDIAYDFNLIYIVMFKMPAAELKYYFKTETVRDCLKEDQLSMLDKLQQMNYNFLESDLEYNIRRNALQTYFDRNNVNQLDVLPEPLMNESLE